MRNSFLAVLGVALTAGGATLRPPSVPIVSCDPYFSIWSGADAPNLADTEIWHGAKQPVSVEIELDGVRYRLLGKGHGGHSELSAGKTWSIGSRRSADRPALRCVRTEVRPLTSVYTFTDGAAEVRLSFMTPKMADEFDVFSRPVTYATVETSGARKVRVFAEISPALATDDDSAEMLTNRFEVAGMPAYSIGRKEQTPLARYGDCVRCDWGYACLVNPVSEGTSAHFVLAYDDVKTLQFLDREVPAWWRRGGKPFRTMLEEAAADRERLRAKADRFDAALSSELERAGGVRYRELAALAYRQSFAACKLVAGPDGQPLYFSKENSSNGCIGTVDVFYPQLPLLLAMSPALTRATLEPILIYASSGRWPYGYAPHDLGGWPFANGQWYGFGKDVPDAKRMPVEESGNMLIALAALAGAEGNADFADRFWPTVTKWVEYLERFGFDPGEQLCTDDFAGHLAHNANLSVKTIVAFASYAKLAEALGRTDAARKYRALAEASVPKWMDAAKGGASGGYRLAFDRPGSWSQKYNLVWDRVLGLGLFPQSVAEAEMSAYRAQAKPFGVPLDSRSNYTKADWSFWSAALTGRREDLDFVTDLVWRYANETPDRNPFPDFYWTHNGRVYGFLGRPVIGGVFMPLLAARACAGAAAVDVDGLIARMTVEEKVGQLVQVGASKVLAFDPAKKNDVDFTGPISRGEVGALLFCADARQYNAAQKAAQASRLKIPLLVGIDAVHGCDTVYPIPLAEACSWDEDLWRRTAEATALECRLNGFNWTFAPMIDIARDARWGRIAESAGADPLVASRFAAAKVRGFQGENPADGRHVLACPKHFAAYGMAEGGRDYNLVEVSDATLRDVILPPFRAAFDAGAVTVMSGFHTVNGEPCSTSRALLTDVLRGEMGFTGFVVSDCNAIHQCGPRMHGVAADDADAAVQALVAGVDMDMNSDVYRKTLVESVKKGLVPQVTLDAAVRRILLAKRALGLFENPYVDLDAAKRAVDVKANLALAREAAGKSVVLLKNEGGLLPLKAGTKVALVGDLARNRDEMSGCWYAFYRHTENATLEEGLKADGVTVVGSEDEADVIIGAFGESRSSNGENNSRASLALPPEQLQEVRRLKASGKPFVAVLFNGRPLAVPELAEAADALVEAWNPGSCAGWGLADVITGAVNPSAKLVVDFPHATGESPAYYATPPTGRPGDPKKRWSTRYIDAPSPSRMLFPFGFGISYTTFAYANESIRREGDALVLEADITNTGKVSGREIVQAYTHLVVGRTSRPRRELKGFAAVTLAPGETCRVSIRVPLSALSYHVGKTKVAATGEIEAWIAPDSVSGRKISMTLDPT